MLILNLKTTMKRSKSYLKNNGVLYLVATPIGNLNEISSRALDILKSVDIIACEDTRNSSKLLNHFDIKKKLVSYHNFNEEESTKGIIELLINGKNIALISDAGYPLVSDPGYELVNKCRQLDIPVSTISGPNAGLNALVASGLSTTHFYFYGFLNAKQSQAKKELENIKDCEDTIIFYEAPHRIEKTIKLMYEVLGNRKAVIARELTKLHEEYITGTLEEMTDLHDLKGEIVIIVEGRKKEIVIDEKTIMKEIKELIKQGTKAKEACGIVAEKYKQSKNDLYNKWLGKKK